MPDGDQKVSAAARAIAEQHATTALNLHQRLHAVMMDVDYVQKDRHIPGGGGGYKVVTHDAVTGKVRPALVKHRVNYYPQNLSYQQNGNRTEITMTVKFVNIDNPGDYIEVPTIGFGIDQGDKGPGKAVSYAVKYALLKALGLETGEDADDTADVKHEAAPADPVTKKNVPGITKIKNDTREAGREIGACEDANSLIAYLNLPATKKLAVTVCRDWQEGWEYPEQPEFGLKGLILNNARTLVCEPEATAWINKVEEAARQK